MTLGCVNNGVPWLGGLAWGAVMFLNLKRAASGVWWFGTPFGGERIVLEAGLLCCSHVYRYWYWEGRVIIFLFYLYLESRILL